MIDAKGTSLTMLEEDEGAVSDSSTSDTLSLINPSILQYNTSSFMNETKVTTIPSMFSYKGVGFSLVKSFRSLKSFGVNLKVPITQHFPRYDRHQYLPRVGASIGMHFPIDYKCTFSASIPVLTAFYGFAVLAKMARLGKKDFKKQFISGGDPLRRVGVAVSFRYNYINGFRITFGPWVNQLSNRRLIDMILPFFAVVPTVAMFCLNILSALLSAVTSVLRYLTLSKLGKMSPDNTIDSAQTSIDKESESDSDSESGTDRPIENKNNRYDDAAAASISLKSVKSREKKTGEKNKKTPSRKPYSRKKYDPRILHSRILEWVSSKGPNLGCSVGTYITRQDGFYLGGNMFVDLQYLFPFQNELRYLRDRCADLRDAVGARLGSRKNSLVNRKNDLSAVEAASGEDVANLSICGSSDVSTIREEQTSDASQLTDIRGGLVPKTMRNRKRCK